MSKSKKDKIKINKSKLKEYKLRFYNWLKYLITEQHLTDLTYSKINTIALKIINSIKVMIASFRRFMKDDCFTKSSALGYTVLISLIPTLTVALTILSAFRGFGDKKSELFKSISKFMSEHNLQRLNIDSILMAISSLIDNATKIGIIGAVVVIFSATAVLRTLEKSLNNIWNVKRQRTLYLKIIYYWAALTLGPILIISGNTIANKFSNVFLEPNHNSITQHENKIWLVGNKGDIRYKDLSNKQTYVLDIHNIDFENQNILKYSPEIQGFTKEEYAIEESEIANYEYSDIQFIEKNGWIAGKNGILLTSENSGKKWQINKIGNFNFNDIYMADSNNGFLIADNGYYLKTTDGGKSWYAGSFNDTNFNLNQITAYKNKLFIIGENGILIKSEDKGVTWKISYIPEAKNGNNYVSLNKIYIHNDNNYWVLGDNGIILHSTNSGKSWMSTKFQRYNYCSIIFLNNKEGFIGGEKGILLHTKDYGEHWAKRKLPTKKITAFFRYKNELWSTGFAGMFMTSDDFGKKWQGKKGTNFFVYLMNFMAPFFFIWLLFLLIYMALPNIKIPFKPAAIGAALTGTMWVLFSMVFKIYIKAFANSTFAIYGALAAIPIFLILIYGSSVIILFGAEVSYTIMHPETYLKVGQKKKLDDNYLIFNGLNLLHHIYKKFESNKGYSKYKELLKVCMYRYDEVDYLIDKFKLERFIMEKSGGGFIPSTSSKNVHISRILEIIHDYTFDIPSGISNDSFKKKLNELFAQLNSSHKEILKDLTLDKLI